MGSKRSQSSASTEWELYFASAKAQSEWLSSSEREPEIMEREEEFLRTRPRDRGDNPRRTGPLKGRYARATYRGSTYPQWQREITSTGRLWYLVDTDGRRVIITKVSLSHPKDTE